MRINYTSKKLNDYLSIMLIFTLILMFLVNNIVSNSIVKSSIWLVIILIICIAFPKVRGIAKLKHIEQFYLYSLKCGIIYIVIYFGSGIILGFGKSPYSRGINNIVLNLFIFITPIVGRELIRGFLLNNSTKHKSLNLVFITILMIITDITISQVTKISTVKELIIFISQSFGPLICLNIFASYACIVAGPITSIIFLSLITGIEIVSPVLPLLQWLTRGLINMCVPIFSYLAMNFYYTKLTKQYKEYKGKHENIFSMMAVSVFSIFLIWFTIGVFPIYPSVIVTGSMKPIINPGDIVVIKKIQKVEDIDNLKTGDIIQFKREELLIVHRIIELVKNEEDGLIYFRTKGDNNSAEDNGLVNPNDIKGTVYKTIPKLGWPTLILRNNNNIPFEDIEF